MKTKILLCLIFAVIGCTAFSQYNFVVQNGTTSVYKTLDEAYANAQNSDTIYLPGGSFNMPAIDKSLTWIGVGYHPDSTNATYYTNINNAVTFSGNCDNSFVTGINFSSNVSIGSKGDDAVDFTISRCKIIGNLYLKYNDGTSEVINAKVSECICDGAIIGALGRNIVVEKCIIKGSINDFRDSYIDRCLFTSSQYSYNSGISFCFNNTQYCLIRNSVFNYNRYYEWRIDFSNCINNQFLNNIFAGHAIFPNGTNTGLNNQVGVSLAAVFETIDGPIENYSYNHNFHLKAGSPAIGTGTSGTDIGLYDGTDPYKEGGLPKNPHIRSISVNDETTEGMLPVIIAVGAQSK